MVFKINGGEHRPSWALVLSYEHEVRKAAIEKISYDKLDIETALNSVYRDTEHRQQHFLTPVMGALVARSPEDAKGSQDAFSRGRPLAGPYDSSSQGPSKRFLKKQQKGDGASAGEADGDSE